MKKFENHCDRRINYNY